MDCRNANARFAIDLDLHRINGELADSICREIHIRMAG